MAQVKTESEMFPLVESWQKSGLTQKQFSQQHGISEHVFCYWISRYRKVHPAGKTKPVPAAGPAPAFIRLSAPAGPLAAAIAPRVTDAATVVELPSGIVVRFTGHLPVAYLKELIGLSTSACPCSA